MAAGAFRDVTLMYTVQDQGWCDYVLKHFRNDRMKMRLEVVPLDMSDGANPPEIEVAVRESHVLFLLTTSYLLGYMEQKKAWLPALLRKSDPEVSRTVFARLDTPREDMDSFCSENGYDFDDGNDTEILDDGSNIISLIAYVMELVETYVNKKTRRDSAPRRPSETPIPVEIIPASLHKPGEKVALIFKEEVKGKVTVNFRFVKEDIHCEFVNPYCVIFEVPEVSGSSVSMTIYVDGTRHSRHKLPNNVKTYQYSSVELLCQTYGASSREELDKMLSSKLSQSLYADPLATRIFDVPPEKPGSFEGSDKLYPTILHWAAAHGFRELCSALLSAPGAALACDINNVNGCDPIDLARKNGYPELSDLIDEFIAAEKTQRKDSQETQELANTCDLYLQTFCGIAEVEEEIGGEYEEMVSPGQFVGTYTPVGPKRGDQSSAMTLPPLPAPRTSRSGSLSQIPPEDDLPSPKDFFGMISKAPPLARGAVGSRSQTELIEIQEEVKKGHFSLKEAEMLFRSWKERYETGNAVSFKDRQQGLKAFKAQHDRAVETMKKVAPNRKKKKGSKDETAATEQTAITISEPILKRQNFGSQKRTVGAGRGDSTHSNASFQSVDSGRESSVSSISQLSLSFEDSDYICPSESSIFEEESALRPRQESGSTKEGRSQNKMNRISYQERFMALAEEDHADGRQPSPPPPPVPPRPSRVPTQVFTKSGSVKSTPIVPPKPRRK